MPRKPKRSCRYPGCSKLTERAYCEEHQRLMNSHYNKFSRGYDSNERYNSAWRKIRTRYIKQHPLCERCLAEGRYTPADLVHHKKPLSDGGTNENSNLMSLCYSCHEIIHGRGGQNL
ncbi:MAG: HNH endonuclease [Ruminococcaceae bacterium]|nr:HNH endonuclease [Oscillospiraceae bacterium]